MGVSSAFGTLTELIEQFEATDSEVLRVVTEDIDTGKDDSVVVDLTVRTLLFGDVETDRIDLTARTASVNEDGTATVDLAVSIPRSIRSETIEQKNREGEDEGDIQEPTEPSDRRPSGDVPVHRDPDRLREVYAACDTFAEMTEALGTDVTSVTVRRNMIKQGIHEPRSNGSSARTDDGGTDADPDLDPEDEGEGESDSEITDGDVTDGDVTARADDHATGNRVPPDANDPSIDEQSTIDDASPTDTAGPNEAPDSALEHSSSSDDDAATSEGDLSESIDEAVAIPDGIGFPHDLTLDRLTEIVGTSKTLHEAQTRLGLDRDRTRELLGELGVLDLVHGRVSTRHERAASPEEIHQRIRERLSRTA